MQSSAQLDVRSSREVGKGGHSSKSGEMLVSLAGIKAIVEGKHDQVVVNRSS